MKIVVVSEMQSALCWLKFQFVGSGIWVPVNVPMVHELGILRLSFGHLHIGISGCNVFIFILLTRRSV